jgi:predicted MFS family arabinose efflux permease
LFQRKNHVVGYSILIILISMGTRQTFGLYLQPITDELDIGRELFSLAIAIQSIIGGLPFAGVLADRYGSRWVAIGGGLLFAVSMYLMSIVTHWTGLMLGFGLLSGISLSCVSYVVVLGAVAQVVPPERRSRTFGFITAAGSVGMFIVVPVAQRILNTFGWRTTLAILAGFAGLIALLAVGYPTRKQPVAGGESTDKPSDSLTQVLVQASRHSGYWLLTIGFFVCGFHVSFVASHLPAYLTDNGLSGTAGATALSLVGLFNLFGSTLFGYLGDHYRKKYLLSGLYLGRSIIISLFIFFPVTETTAMIFGAAIGFLWLATVPLTSGTVAQIFGPRYLSTLYGIVFFSHQIGSFLGVWLGGRIYDATGMYTPVWVIAIILGVLACIVHLPIVDRPVYPLRTTTAASR